MIAPNWHPKIKPPPRPTWLKLIPSAAGNNTTLMNELIFLPVD